MKQHVEDHIEQMQDEPIDHGDVHRDNKNASGLYGKNPIKKGAKPKSIVENTADLIDFKIKKGELSKDNVYVLVDYDDKHYIVTLRYVAYCMFKDLIAKYSIMIHEILSI